jgi:hypothetical protein
MKKWALFLSVFFTHLIQPFCAHSQLIKATFITRECSLNCGASFIYNSEFVFTKDSIKIITPAETVVGQYLIIKNQAKWKDVNYHGKAKIMAMNISDSSIREFKLTLRQGKGYLNIFEKGDCEMVLRIESGKIAGRNNVHVP